MVNIADIKLPPHHIEAEKGTLACILLSPEDIITVFELGLKPEDFYQKEHQMIFLAIKDLWEEKKEIDVITLSNKLIQRGELETVGGIEYLYELSNFVYTPTVLGDYTKIVIEKAKKRKLKRELSIAVAELDDDKDLNEIVKATSLSLTAAQSLEKGTVDLNEVLVNIISNYGNVATTYKTGYPNLDKLIQMKKGDLAILGARPAMGKSAVVLNIARNQIKNNKRCILFSLEMGAEQVMKRFLASELMIPLNVFTKNETLPGRNQEETLEELSDRMGNSEIIGQLNNLIFVDDGNDFDKICSRIRKEAREGLDFVFIDYLQLMSIQGFGRGGSKTLEISHMTQNLKNIARELGIVIVLLSQLSRGVEQRPDKRPQLSDLRESGSIEQDADIVIMLYREDYYDADTDRKGSIDVLVRKNRDGETGDVELKFLGEYMRIENKISEETPLQKEPQNRKFEKLGSTSF